MKKSGIIALIAAGVGAAAIGAFKLFKSNDKAEHDVFVDESNSTDDEVEIEIED